MRIPSSLFALGLALSAPVLALADTPLSDRLGEGSSIHWASNFNGSSQEGYREKVLLKSGDAELFRHGDEDDKYLDSDSYFMLFSGILYRACTQEMPTEAEREALEGLWPLTEGTEVTIESDGGATIIVGAPTEYFLMGASRPAHIVDVKFEASTEDENLDENLIILDDAKMTAQINWQDGSIDRVMLVTSAKGPETLSPKTMELLDQCLPFVGDTAQTQQE